MHAADPVLFESLINDFIDFLCGRQDEGRPAMSQQRQPPAANASAAADAGAARRKARLRRLDE